MQTQKTEILTILHFNDCYNIEEREQEPVGGVARFHTALHSYDKEDPLVLFSGDLYAPSTLSNIYEGKQLIKPINMLNIKAACFGNHDFDYEEDALIALTKASNFPWLISNVTWPGGAPLANGKEFVVIEHGGHRIGIMGLIEYEWLITLKTVPLEEVTYTDFVKKAKELQQKLKVELQCDLVIALTHMRSVNDHILAKEVPELDLILGGHDHVVEIERIRDTYVIKSGADFKQFSHIQLQFVSPEEITEIKSGKHPTIKSADLLHEKFTLQLETIEVSSKYEPNAELKEHVDGYMKELAKLMDINIGYLDEEFEARFEKVRAEETNSANFFADILRASMEVDVVLYNAGTIRADYYFQKGFFKLKDLINMIPYLTPMTVIQISGEDIIKALEAGFERLPALEGRFPMVSGITMDVDKSKPPGERVVRSSVKIKGNPINLTAMYKLGTPEYLASGKDGYDIFASQKPVYQTTENNTFVQTEAVKFFDLRKDPHFMEFYRLMSNNSVSEGIDYQLGEVKLRRFTSVELRKKAYCESVLGLISRVIDDNGTKLFAIAPKVENRIRYI